MTISSHRLKIEERKVYRKLILTIAAFIITVVAIIYGGIPLLTKTIILLTSPRKDSSPANVTQDSILTPPVFDPMTEATNSATITVSGIADKESTVKIMLNDEEIASAYTDKDAKFTAINVKLSEGTNTITAKTLKNDKESTSSAPLVIIYKKNPPKLDISSPGEGQKFLSENKDITISGSTDPGNRITVNDRFAIVDQYGKFAFKVTLSSGDNNFKVTATDPAGNQTEISRKVNYTP